MAPSGDWQAELNFAHELADLADAITLPPFSTGLTVETKADGTAVTAADRDAERAMRAAIRQRFPHHAVLGEEDGREGPEDAPTWILDPIDGTANFIRGVPIFATLIALAVEDTEVVGVVSAPAMHARWDGRAGGPARRGTDEIRVSQVETLAEAMVSFGGLRYFDRHGWSGVIDRVTAATARQRGFGDFWHHVLVATGSVDLALEAEVSRWDLAAVKCIVEAAGGRFSSLTGEITSDGGNGVSSNGRLHDELLALVADAG